MGPLGRQLREPTDRRAVADTFARTRLSTVAGELDWTCGPTPNIACLPLIGGQWIPGRHHTLDLALVTNAALPAVRTDREPARCSAVSESAAGLHS
ncbi:hypothetical protein ACIHCQ_04920 [Streptomyces sp. NPDC052236]|uniref:hypothetical protein n=1 Tax=Streptomyces sp. NPDC052236 TaxID=3365686 RepID=UPI0037D26856